MLSLAACVSNSSIDDKNALLDEARRNDPDRIHSILFTSGTSTGRPKGCPQRAASMTHVLQHLDWLINPSNCSHVLQQAHNSRAIAPTHTIQTWKCGGEVVMASASFAIGDTLEAILRHNVSFIVLSPAMVHALEYELIPHPSKTHSVRTVHLGGDVITKDVLAKSAALFPSARICISHGMTEGLGFFEWPFLDSPISQIPAFGEICPTGSVAAGSRLRIWDPDKKAVARGGKPGELHVCCASIIQHYLGGVGESSFYEDEKGRWFVTGDMAMMNEKGLVYILGRTKDVIKRANVTIMPAALESCIEKYVDAQVSSILSPIRQMQFITLTILFLQGFCRGCSTSN
jgi:acyl-CoA synthetase (AMP-forming)/AMP-acid ligase II